MKKSPHPAVHPPVAFYEEVPPPPGLNPSALVIHTGTNDVEQQSIDTCFDNFKTLIDLSTQKYPTSKLILSSLTARSGDYDAKGVQLNNGLSRLRERPLREQQKHHKGNAS